MTIVLILGSAPAAVEARDWDRSSIDRIVAVNNAHLIRPDWDDSIYPYDFPEERRPKSLAKGQRVITQESFVPAMNAFGGFVYGGGTMAFTAAYWALHQYRPRVLAWFGCDMVYPASGRTHFYGKGTPDPLRDDITLRSLEAKSARLMVLAAMRGTAVVNLSQAPSRLVVPRATLATLRSAPVPASAAMAAEAEAGYYVPSGRYWDAAATFSAATLDRIDALWLDAAGGSATHRLTA